MVDLQSYPGIRKAIPSHALEDGDIGCQPYTLRWSLQLPDCPGDMVLHFGTESHQIISYNIGHSLLQGYPVRVELDSATAVV